MKLVAVCWNSVFSSSPSDLCLKPSCNSLSLYSSITFWSEIPSGLAARVLDSHRDPHNAGGRRWWDLPKNSNLFCPKLFLYTVFSCYVWLNLFTLITLLVPFPVIKKTYIKVKKKSIRLLRPTVMNCWAVFAQRFSIWCLYIFHCGSSEGDLSFSAQIPVHCFHNTVGADWKSAIQTGQ